MYLIACIADILSLESTELERLFYIFLGLLSIISSTDFNIGISQQITLWVCAILSISANPVFL